MAATRITVRVDPKLRRKLDRLARERGKRSSEMVREALEAYCSSEGTVVSCYDLAVRAGIIGMIEDGPSDVSTNPKYLKGFGRD